MLRKPLGISGARTIISRRYCMRSSLFRRRRCAARRALRNSKADKSRSCVARGILEARIRLACVLMTVNLFDALRLLRGADLATSFWLPFKGLRLSGNPTGAPVSAHVRVASLIGRWGAGFGPCQSSEKYLHCVHLSRV
jgi:hypothetical protein